MNGLLLVDKPTGLTSHDVVGRLRRSLGIRAIGHAGTLDPLASGLLIALVGEATKVSDYLLNGDKAYEFSVKLGLRTDSFDVTGETIDETDVAVSNEQLQAAVQSLTGAVELEVPVHSAVKVDGKRLYKFAHRGERPPDVPKRQMHFYNVQMMERSGDDVLIRLHCSKGSFVRAWANEFGNKLGCGGTVKTLRRIESVPFSVVDALPLKEIENRKDYGSAWISLSDCLPHFQRLDVFGRDEKLLRNGQISKTMETELLRFVRFGEAPPAVRVISRETNDLLALLLAEKGQFYRIKRVFNPGVRV